MDAQYRREVIPSMLRRLSNWDYRSRAIYQITVTLSERPNDFLGHLEVRCENGPWQPIGAVNARELSPEAVRARIVPSEAGLATLAALEEMPKLFPEVQILARELMPDHLHFVLFVKSPLAKPMGALIRGFKAGAAKRWKELVSAGIGRAQNPAQPSGSPASRAPCENPAPARPVPSNSFDGLPCWSPGYQDTILFREGQLDNMKRYLADNPRRLAIKRLFPELFRSVDELAIELAVGRAFDACAAGRLLMLAPAAWPYSPGEKPMTRFDATALNRLTQWIAGEGAATINYHGMQPTDTDHLAKAAAKISS